MSAQAFRENARTVKWPWKIGKNQAPGLAMLVALAKSFAVQGMEPTDAWMTITPLCYNRDSPYYYEHEAKRAFSGLVKRGICIEDKSGWKLTPDACKALGIARASR